jgi:hypothetical protein
MRALALFLLLFPPALHAVQARPAVARIGAALSVPVGNLKVYKTLPAALLDRSKADVFWHLAHQTPAPAVYPLKPLLQLNGALVDIGTPKLAKTSKDELEHIAKAVLHGLEPDQAPSVEGVAALSSARFDRLMAARGSASDAPVYSDEPYMPALADRPGVPEHVRPAERGIFRHYTTPAGLAAIRETGLLHNSVLPYVKVYNRMGSAQYPDLGGVFLTRPDATPEDVGVAADRARYYVDFEVPEDVPVLEIERGRIYVVPLPTRPKNDEPGPRLALPVRLKP